MSLITTSTLVPMAGTDEPLLAELGLKFRPIDSRSAIISLPDGWRCRKSHNPVPETLDFFDLFGHRRVVVRQRECDGVLAVIAVTRYYLMLVTTSLPNTEQRMAGVLIRDNSSFPNGHPALLWQTRKMTVKESNQMELRQALMAEAATFLDKFYADHRDPRAYWTKDGQ